MAGIEANQPPANAVGRTPGRTRVPDSEVAELRDVRFSTSLRGYDRDQVDAFVGRVNQVIAELQITAAPESAIRHALKQVTEETQGILERAHETADEITEHAKQEAQQRHEASENDARQLRDDAAHEAREVREATAREAREVREAAQSEAREVREAGEARGAELEADAQAILEERARRIAELRDLVRRLGDFTDAAANRYPTPHPPVAEVPEPAPDEDPADLDSAP